MDLNLPGHARPVKIMLTDNLKRFLESGSGDTHTGIALVVNPRTGNWRAHRCLVRREVAVYPDDTVHGIGFYIIPINHE